MAAYTRQHRYRTKPWGLGFIRQDFYSLYLPKIEGTWWNENKMCISQASCIPV